MIIYKRVVKELNSQNIQKMTLKFVYNALTEKNVRI